MYNEEKKVQKTETEKLLKKKRFICRDKKKILFGCESSRYVH